LISGSSGHVGGSASPLRGAPRHPARCPSSLTFHRLAAAATKPLNLRDQLQQGVYVNDWHDSIAFAIYRRITIPSLKTISGGATTPAPSACPEKKLAVNAAWYYLQGIAADLIAWLKLLGCSGHLARAEPRTLQFQVFHTPATLTRGGRRRWLNLPPDWPWSTHIQAIFDLLFALPVPT